MNSDKLKRRYMERWNQVAKEESEAMSVAKIGLLRRWLSPRDGPYKAALEVIRLSDIEKRGFAVVDAAEEMLQIGHLEPSRETYKLVLGELTRVSEGIRRNVSAGDQTASVRIEAQVKVHGFLTGARLKLQRVFEDAEARGASMARRAGAHGGVHIDQVHVSGGVFNLQSTIGSITQNITRIQQQDPALAEAFRAVTEAIEHVESEKRREGLQAIQDLLVEAEKSPSNRRKSRLIGGLSLLAATLSASTDVLNYFGVHLEQILQHVEQIRKFFRV